MENLYLCSSFIWAIVGISITSNRKEIRQICKMDEHLYVMDIQSVKMDAIIQRGCMIDKDREHIQPFNEYQWDLIDNENKSIRKKIAIGCVATIIYCIFIYLMMSECYKYM